MRYQVADSAGAIIFASDNEYFACNHADWRSRQERDATFAAIDARDGSVLAMYCNGEDLEVTK